MYVCLLLSFLLLSPFFLPHFVACVCFVILASCVSLIVSLYIFRNLVFSLFQVFLFLLSCSVVELPPSLRKEMKWPRIIVRTTYGRLVSLFMIKVTFFFVKHLLSSSRLLYVYFHHCSWLAIFRHHGVLHWAVSLALRV